MAWQYKVYHQGCDDVWTVVVKITKERFVNKNANIIIVEQLELSV